MLVELGIKASGLQKLQGLGVQRTIFCFRLKGFGSTLYRTGLKLEALLVLTLSL